MKQDHINMESNTKILEYKDVDKVVESYPRKYKEGFLQEEIEDLLSKYSNIHIPSFEDAMMGNTCALIDNKVISYVWDVSIALKCGVEKRGMKPHEFD